MPSTMNKFFNYKISSNMTVKELLIIFLVIFISSVIIQLCYYTKITYDEMHNLYNKNNELNNQIEVMNQEIIILSQQIDKWKVNSMKSNHYDFETPIDYHYYLYIKNNNSFSHPLTDDQIWGIVTELKNCKTDPNLLLALAKTESSFNASAVSKVGCIGLMQINPIHNSTYNFRVEDLYDPVVSIRIADQLITDWQKKGKLTTSEICKKYLGCHSNKYLSKVEKNLKDL